MTLAPTSGTLILAIALLFAAFTPARAYRDVERATVALVISWGLCAWSCMFDLTPAQIILDVTGQYVDPYRIWALQDALLSGWLASVWLLTRGRVTAIVGLLLAAQLVIHALAQQFGFDRQSYIDTLFVAQLVAISLQGGGIIGSRLVLHCRRLLDLRFSFRAA